MAKIGKQEIEDILLGYGCNDKNRWQIFCQLDQEGCLTEEAYNYGLNLAYTTGRPDGPVSWYFMDRRVSKELIMDENDKLAYNSLPQTIKIYRGCNVIEGEEDMFGLSWTTERKVAEFFAFRHFNHNGRVYEKEIDKRDIIAYFTDRNEYEAIVILEELEYSNYGSPKIVTDKPTELYIKYQFEVNPYLCKELKKDLIDKINNW